MRKLKLISFHLAFLFSQITIGQYDIGGISVEFSEIHGMRDYDGYLGFAKGQINDFFLLGFESGDYKCEWFDSSLASKRVFSFKPAIKGESIHYFDIYGLNDEVYVFGLYQQKGKERTEVFYRKFNRDSLRFEEKVVFDSSLVREDLRLIDYNVFLIFSADSSKLLVFQDVMDFSGKNDRVVMHVFDRDWTLVWGDYLVMPHDRILTNKLQAEVNSDGTVYVLSKINEPPTDTDTEVSLRHYFELEVYSKNKRNTSYITLGNRIISDARFQLAGEEQAAIGGYYTYENKNTMAGVFALRIDLKAQKVLEESVVDFQAEFMAQHEPKSKRKKIIKKATRKDHFEFDNYDVQSVLVESDGGLTIIGERFFSYVTTGTSQFARQALTEHFYLGNILITHFTPELNARWMELIPKSQYMLNSLENRASFSTVRSDLATFFIFNDHQKNLYYKNSGSLYQWSSNTANSEITVARITAEGRYNKGILPDTFEERWMINTAFTRSISSNQFVLQMMRNSEQRVAVVTIEESSLW
ncbi:MAG TPA: hypothetical protein DDX92_01885 [Flavobacteriales bacterium]|jgi:hypothetical protein|nr:hypothetical protein [Flavobacteriales bacterium]